MVESHTIRKVQAYSGDRSLTVVLPKVFAEQLRIGKGDFLKVHLEDEKLVLEKAEV
jgi:bifunctional DNA-binding transcriptional regulator/antitoxin component of YhaV-PrlF toxin-antitoxin module